MCDIWKDNKNLKQLTEEDIRGLLVSLKKFGTKQVLMSGGEALLNPNFFKFCEILKRQGISITLLSTGLTLEKNAERITEFVHDLIVSLDGDEETHDEIRNIQGAYSKLKNGVRKIKSLQPSYKVTSRTVIHKMNYKIWPKIIDCAKEIGIVQVSFLPADVSSHAFNREMPWDIARQHEVMPEEDELPALDKLIKDLSLAYAEDFRSHYIAESTEKIQNIHTYYSALYGLKPFPYKKCNAPWVSTVVEADGTVRPCFFHDAIGNIHNNSLEKILNSPESFNFRKSLDTDENTTCVKCVCYMHLSPFKAVP
jgi:MoaA/NifB/PqqE/SkfB family radical SAM enzyme